MLHRKIKQAIEDEASKQGVSVEFEEGTKHVQLVITRGDHVSRQIMSRNKKEVGNQEDWGRQKVRRAVREFDAIS